MLCTADRTRRTVVNSNTEAELNSAIVVGIPLMLFSFIAIPISLILCFFFPSLPLGFGITARFGPVVVFAFIMAVAAGCWWWEGVRQVLRSTNWKSAEGIAKTLALVVGITVYIAMSFVGAFLPASPGSEPPGRPGLADIRP